MKIIILTSLIKFIFLVGIKYIVQSSFNNIFSLMNIVSYSALEVETQIIVLYFLIKAII